MIIARTAAVGLDPVETRLGEGDIAERRIVIRTIVVVCHDLELRVVKRQVGL